MADSHVEKLGGPTEVQMVTRAGTSFQVNADEVITPNTEHGLVRLKLDGKVVCVMLANQFAAWSVGN